MIKLPGLIDPHVHLREPGAIHKEDFDSGTAAALAGGFTIILAMPNTNPPLTDAVSLQAAKKLARAKARCDYAFFLGAGDENLSTGSALAGRVCGMKMYLDQTYGPLRLTGLQALEAHLTAWPVDRPLAVHAEDRSLATVLLFSGLHDRPIHVCHVSRAEEILLIRKAKEKGYPVTCEVGPHHLFLTEEDIPHLGVGRSEVRPRLATARDQETLWNNLDVIDCFATDHAPHTLEEKDGLKPPPGFPGLETALSLLYGAVLGGRLTLDELIARMVTNPRKIFSLPEQQETWVEFDPEVRWTVRASEFNSRCGWTPFEGLQLQGRVRQVTLRGRPAFVEDQVVAPLGYGEDLAPDYNL
jgi:carbamoyl-phosphate synthase / aspartate carbamoyltransferase / dihydroorotase